MNKYLLPLISVFVIVCMLAFLTSCSSSDNDEDSGSFTDIFGPDGPEELDPSEWDFYLGVIHDDWDEDFTRDSTHLIVVMLINPDALTGDLTVKKDGETVALDNEWDVFWFGEIDLVMGQSYNFELVTPSKSYSASLQIPYNATSATFPETFDPTQSYTVSWNLQGNNKYQFAEAWSYLWDWEDWENDQESVYFEELSPSDRQHTFPANAVESFGPETEYDLSIIQADFKATGKLAAVAASAVYEWYYDHDYREEITRKDVTERVVRIIEHLK